LCFPQFIPSPIRCRYLEKGQIHGAYILVKAIEQRLFRWQTKELTA